MNYNAGAYLRLSRDDEREGESLSIENQRAIVMDFITKKGWTLIDTYIDEGLSGYYSDRPQYMQMLRDIGDNKIRAVICYKFDRISRKTLDLLNLVEQLKVKKIAFISCTDDVDTSSRTGKIVMSLLASIAEFERDIIAERIADNMYELAKEGRWLGGTTPLGFYSKKEHLNIGGRKTTVNHLEPVEEEQSVVKEMYQVFLERRSLGKVVEWAESKKLLTRMGKAHTRISVRNILQNPVYAIADSDSYDYFKAFDVPIYAEQSDFDGMHGLMIYNKTEQTKELREDSTAIHPEYVCRQSRREVSAWIIAIGQHKGIVSGREWIRAQGILQDNHNKIKRPKEDTQALLSGLIYCPLCNKNMYTHRESGRYTGDKPRFLYKCQTHKYDPKACEYGDVKGNSLDQFVLDAICKMSDPATESYQKLMSSELALQLKSNDTNSEMKQLNQAIQKIQREIEGQTKNLRLAADATRVLLMEDLERLANQMAAYETRRQELQCENMEQHRNTASFEKAKQIILSFPRLLEALSYQNKLELVHKIIARVYVAENAESDDEVHIFLKGSPDEDYTNFFTGEHDLPPACVMEQDSICYVEYIDTGFFVNTSNGCKLHTAFECHPLKQNATVGERIRHFRSKRGIMIETLTEKSGVSRDAIIRYENGQTEPSPKNLLAIAEALDVNPDKLCDEYYRFLLYPYGKRIKEMRRKLGLTQQEFAEKYEFTIDSIKRWEQGINRVTREQWERLNEILAALVA